MDRIHVVISMDCEPVRAKEAVSAATSGPTSYEDSARFITGYWDHAARYGFPVSFFVHPEAAVAHPRLFLDLEAKGACLGLHLHPYKFDPTCFRTHFGALSAAGQTALVSEAGAIWRSGIGRRPRYFRPGTFSANDNTFRVLAELGFEGGSMSCPGRNYPDLYAVWAGAPFDPHRANDVFRLMEGGMDFVELPLTVDTSVTEVRNGRSFFRDLRPDYLSADYPAIARNVVRQLQERAPVVKMIMVVTHNDHDFSDPDDRVCRNFQTVLKAIDTACAEAGVEAAGATVESVCAAVRERCPGGRPAFTIGHASIQTG